ncbi:carbohydrate-binding module family 21 protein, partial [Aureobasidium melanogenum]
MPYTPPSHQSPASSKTTSPAMSRSSSFSAESSGTRSPASPRPALPRSVSSTTYLNKQRRGPSITQQEPAGLPQSPVGDDESSTVRHIEGVISNNGSIRQSPSPVNNLLIPTGAILSPPDSSENSDGEDTAETPRGRNGFSHNWGELQQAVRSIELKREGSPARGGVSFSEPTTTIHSPTALSATARKISHSRSSTETAIIIPDRIVTESPSEESDDDDELRVKPPLVRKKSGELVKPALRPSSRRRYSSMPGTPTYSKSVHFNDNGNQTRHFLQVEKPSAISAGSSPVDTYDEENEYPFEGRDNTNKTEWTLRLANFPEDTHERKHQPVRVEKVYLSTDTKTLIGTVAVANISFQKHVAARFTLDYWKTTSEVMAEYDNDVRKQNPHDGYDRFTFNIRLSDQANLENKTLLLCIRYNSGGQEHWDSNNGMNYQIDFVKKLAKSASTSSLSSLPSSRPSRNTIPRSRHSPPATSMRQERSLFGDEDLLSKSSTYHFGSPEKLTGDHGAQPQVKLKPRSKRVDLTRAGSAPANGLGGRYDFGASLSAALSNAQDKLGKQSGLLPHTQSSSQPQGHYFSPRVASEVKPVVPERPDAITTDRPAIGSQQYKDLVNKFCYFTPGSSGKSSPSPQTSSGSKSSSTDGSGDGASPNEYSPRSGSVTPTPPQSLSPFLDGANDGLTSCNDISKLISRSGSPASFSNSNNYVARAYSYPYARDGYLSESHTPTAIRG